MLLLVDATVSEKKCFNFNLGMENLERLWKVVEF